MSRLIDAALLQQPTRKSPTGELDFSDASHEEFEKSLTFEEYSLFNGELRKINRDKEALYIKYNEIVAQRLGGPEHE